MECCSEMIISGYKGGIYEAIMSLFGSERVRLFGCGLSISSWFCALYLIWENQHLFIMLDLEGNSLPLHGR